MKIALIRVISQDYGDSSEWVKDHMTDFVEATPEEVQALQQFVYTYNKRESPRYVLVEDETHTLPKTIAEALEYAKKKKEEWALEEEKKIKEKKAKAKIAAARKKARETEKLKKTVAELEKYKEKLAKLEAKGKTK